MTVHAILRKAVRGRDISKGELQQLVDHHAGLKAQQPHAAVASTRHVQLMSAVALDAEPAAPAANETVPAQPAPGANETVPAGTAAQPVPTDADKDKITAAINSPEGQLAILNDVKKASKAANDASKLFKDIGDKLLEVDNANLVPDQKLRPGWLDLDKQFHDRLWASRNDAIQLSAFCDRYTNVYFPIFMQKETSDADKNEEIDILLEDIEGYLKTAAENGDALHALSSSVNDYAINFKSFAKTQKDALTKEIGELSTDITTLGLEIDALSAKITSYGISLGVAVFATAAACAFLPEAAPLFIIAGIAASATLLGLLIDALKKKGDKVAEREAKRAQVASDTETLDAINAAQTKLVVATDQAKNLATALGIAAAGWDSFRAELQLLKVHFTAAEKDRKIFKTKDIELTDAVWKAFRKALDYYVEDTIHFQPSAPTV